MSSSSFSFFWPYHIAHGILVPQLGIEPMPPSLEAQTLNHWTTGTSQSLPSEPALYEPASLPRRGTTGGENGLDRGGECVLVVKKEGRGERKEVINGISKGKLLY